MIRVHEQLRANPLARLEHRTEIRHDVRIRVQHRRDEHCRRPIIDLSREPLRQRGCWPAHNLHNLDTLLRQPIQLAPNRVKLTIRGNELGTLAKGQGGQKPYDQLMRVRRQRDSVWGVVEQSREPTSYFNGFVKRFFPYVVHVFCRIEPRLLLRRKRHVGPRLMGMSGEQNTLCHPKATVVFGQLSRVDHSSDRIAQRSGNAG